MPNTPSTRKQYRHRYFSIEIETGLKGSQVSHLFHSLSSQVEGLHAIQFVTPRGLETTLQELVVQEKNPKIVVVDFIGQLQRRTKENLPYWKISCQTSSATTAISLARALSDRLFGRPNSTLPSSSNSIDSRIKVRKRENLEVLDSDFQVSFPDSNWSSGYINHQLSRILHFLENLPMREEILFQRITESPKARIILRQLTEIMREEKEVKSKKLK